MADTIENGALLEEAEPQTAPWHFWAIATVGLLWNSFGAYDYTSYQLGVGPRIPAVQAAPIWATACWALGVWGSFAGSLLMLLRNRHAVPAFAVSFVAALISFGWQYSVGLIAAPILPLVILAAVAFFWWYAARMRAEGTLR